MRRFVLRFVLGAVVLLLFYELVQFGSYPDADTDAEAWLVAGQTHVHLARALSVQPARSDAAALEAALGVTVTPISEADWLDVRKQAAFSMQQGDVHLLVHEPSWEDHGVMTAMLPTGPVRIDAWSLFVEHDEAFGRPHLLGLLVLVFGMAALGAALVSAPARHLRQVARTARALQGGDLTARAEVPKGGLVAPVARALNDMSAQIQRVVEWQELMLQTVAHELRTPLARVRFVATRLGDAADEGERADALADLDHDLTELEDLVSSVLSLTRADHGAALRLEAVDLDGLLRAAIERNRLPHRDTGHPVQLDYAGALEPPATALLDRAAAGRVFDNLLRNAAAHARAEVRVVVTREPDAIVVAVEDDGEGLPEAHRSRIFEPFVRVEDGRARTGTGLGLAIVKRLVEAHGQAVTVGQSDAGGLRVETRWSRASPGDESEAETPANVDRTGCSSEGG